MRESGGCPALLVRGEKSLPLVTDAKALELLAVCGSDLAAHLVPIGAN